MTDKTKTVIQSAIAANLAALSQRLTEAASLAEQAHGAMTHGEQNKAIGTILNFDRLLPEAQALYAAAIALHRNGA
jgi:hypothetical protein